MFRPPINWPRARCWRALGSALLMLRAVLSSITVMLPAPLRASIFGGAPVSAASRVASRSTVTIITALRWPEALSMKLTQLSLIFQPPAVSKATPVRRTSQPACAEAVDSSAIRIPANTTRWRMVPPSLGCPIFSRGRPGCPGERESASGFPLLEVAQALVDQLGGEEVAGRLMAERGELDEVHRHHRFGGEEVAQEAEGRIPEAAARLGGAGRRDEGGVEVVDVEGEVDRLRQLLEELGEEIGGAVELVAPDDWKALRPDHLRLGRRERTDADREGRDAGVDDTLHDAGMAVRRPLELFAQVGVGIELHDADLAARPEHFARRFDRRLAEAVLAAQGDEELPLLHVDAALRLQLGHRFRHVEGLREERRQGGDPLERRLGAELFVVELHGLRGADDRRRTGGGPLAIGGGAFEGDGQDGDAAGFVGARLRLQKAEVGGQRGHGGAL